MSTIIQRGIIAVYGVREPKEIRGTPEGRQRLRMRNGSLTKLFVKTADGIRCFIIVDCGDYWACGPEQGRNIRK